MTNEKMIEEMAKDFRIAHTNVVIGNRYYENIAKNFYNLNYRKIPENAVVLTREELNEKYVLIDALVQVKEELEFIKRQLRIKTDEAEWRADQLQALDKDFETMEKVVRCKDCKWLVKQHYEEEGEEPYIKLVCKLTKRQCQLNDFCSYGEKI